MNTEDSILPIPQTELFSGFHQDCLLTLIDEALLGIKPDLTVLSQNDCEQVLNSVLTCIKSMNAADNRVFLKWLVKHHIVIGESYGNAKHTLDTALSNLLDVASYLGKEVFEEAILVDIDYGYLKEWQLSYLGEFKSKEEFSSLYDIQTNLVRASGFRCVSLEQACHVFWKLDSCTEH